MAKIITQPPSTPKEVKSARRAIKTLEKRAAKIRRDIMNRKVDDLSEARRIASAQEAKATELKLKLRNKPPVTMSKRNKYMRYRMPVRVKSSRRRPRRRVPLKRSIQASIASKNNRLQQVRPAKPFNVARPSSKPPKIKRSVRRTPRRGYIRRMPQSPVRQARSIVKRPSRMSRMFKRMSRRTRSPSRRRALTQEASVQARNAKVAQSQLNQNRLDQQNARIARMRQRFLQQKQSRRRSNVKPAPRDARRIIRRSNARQTYVIPNKSGRPMRVSKPVYDRYMAARKTAMERRRASGLRPVERRPVRRTTLRRPRASAMKIQAQQMRADLIDRSKAARAQLNMLRRNRARRLQAQNASKAITAQRSIVNRNQVSQARQQAEVKAKAIEKQIALLRQKQDSVKSKLNPIQARIATFRKYRGMGEMNLGAIRRNDTLADNHRDNIQELSKLQHEANSLGVIARQLKQRENLLSNQLDITAEQIGNLNANRLFQENKDNISTTQSLEKCLSNKLMQLNQSGHVSGEGIQKAKAIIRQFDKRQISFDEAKARIYRTLKQAHTPKGGDMLKPDVSGLTEAIQMFRMQLDSQGKEFNANGNEQLRKLVNKYAVGQIKTKQEAEAQFTQIVGNPRFVQKKVTIAELGHARALGIAANIRSRKSKQLPAVRQLTAERRAFYDKQRIAEEERLKKSQERVENRQSLAGIFPRTRSAMERMTR